MIPLVSTRLTKYEVVAAALPDARGTLVDIGARDRLLKRHLTSPQLEYLSSDLGPGHDFDWNLERPLPCEDNAYDYVVALDVLEHVEQFHAAFRELLRVTRRRLFVALPNMAHLSHRLRFAWTGRIGAKYALFAEHQGDRHRWLTHYDDIVAFMEHQAATAGVSVCQYNWTTGFTRLERLISFLPLPRGLKAYTVVFVLTKSTAP